MPGAVEVKGLRELTRAFKGASRDARLELRHGLKAVGEPIRVDAERLAATQIRNIGEAWPLMRTGVTQTVVYVAPKQRGTRNASRRRPNLALLLLLRAMEPALERNRNGVLLAFGRLLDDLGRRWER